MADRPNASIPWHHQYAVAAFGAEFVARIIDPSLADQLAVFNSPLLKSLVRLRRAFTLEISAVGTSSEDARFAGAVLAKIAQRGFPAPCSLTLERLLLKQAKQAGITAQERIQAKSFTFRPSSVQENVASLLKACFFAELLLSDEETEGLLDRYRSLCTAPEREFYDLICECCCDPRLALLVMPQRLLLTMVRLTRDQQDSLADRRVDFAVEVPAADTQAWSRLVIEIDDASHEGTQQISDAQRDQVLRGSGWEVRRLLVNAKGEWKSEARRLSDELRRVISEEILQAAKDIRSLPHQDAKGLAELVLLPIVEAQLTVAIARWLFANSTAQVRIANPQRLNLEPVLSSISECLESLEVLYGLPHFGRPSLVKCEEEGDIRFFAFPSLKAYEQLALGRSVVVAPTVAFSEYEDALFMDALPRPLSVEIRGNETRDALTYFLQNLFRKVDFREGQVAILRKSLSFKAVVGLLPAAAGKSLCYQMASLLQPGFTIVVQPLRSLMWDQQDNLHAMGIHRSIAIMSHGEVTGEEEVHLKEEGYRAIAQGFQFFVFVSPERFQIPEFREQVKTFVVNQPIPYCVVDEAHCVSEWGHDFRPAYLNLGRLVPVLCEHRGQRPTIIGLTATASQNVLADILRELNISDPDAPVIPESFDRSELEFEVRKVRVDERFPTFIRLLQTILRSRPGQPLREVVSGLIFSYFVNERYIGVVRLLRELKRGLPQLANAVGIYTGAKPYWFEGSEQQWESEKITLQRRFKRNEVPIVACTHSFGMGIDKPEIRFTIHTMLPRSLEEFYQQAGRAGRDGARSRCIIIFADDQPSLADEALDPVRTPIEKTSELVREVSREQQSDALRNTWFLRNSFLGKETDKAIVDYVWHFLFQHLPARKGDRAKVEVSFNFLPDDLIEEGRADQERKQQALEKAVYRLMVVGAVDDYQKDWGKGKFIISVVQHSLEELGERFVEYLRRYVTEGEVTHYLPAQLPPTYEGQVRLYAQRVVDFVYDRIESRRRQAMREMLETARDATRLGIDRFREQLRAYLEESEFSLPVKDLSPVLPEEWFALLDKAEGVDGLTKLFGACRRQLEESPEHPGLLMLRGVCRLTYGDEGLRDIGGAFIVMRRTYPTISRSLLARRLIQVVRQRFPSYLDRLLETLLETEISADLARLCYTEATPYSFAYGKALFALVGEMLNTLRSGGRANE